MSRRGSEVVRLISTMHEGISLKQCSRPFHKSLLCPAILKGWSSNMYRAANQALQEALRGNSTEFLKKAFERAQSRLA